MLPSLNYDEEDEKFSLLGKVFESIESEKSKNIYNRAGFNDRSMAVVYFKIFFMSLFFNYPVSKVIDELNARESLRNFAKIYDVPTENEVSGYFSQYDPINYFNLVNSYFRTFFKPHKHKPDKYIVDATPVACDINVIKQYIKKEKLEKLGLKWGYSTTKKHFVGFKVTLVLEKDTLTPVAIFIHPGAPSDARIFEGILENLKNRKLIKKGDILYFDKGYFSLKNYHIAINRYRVIPVIFPKSNFSIDRIKESFSLPLEIYKDKDTFEKSKKEITDLINKLVEILNKWEDLKPERGIIEDFFKVGKKAFGLGKFHSYTEKSMIKNILLGFLLTTIVIQQGFKTKTQLQRLSEGYVNFEEPKTNKKKDDSEKEEVTEETEVKTKKEVQQKLDISIKEQLINLFNYSSRKSSKEETPKENSTDDEKSESLISRLPIINNFSNVINFSSIKSFYN